MRFSHNEVKIIGSLSIMNAILAQWSEDNGQFVHYECDSRIMKCSWQFDNKMNVICQGEMNIINNLSIINAILAQCSIGGDYSAILAQCSEDNRQFVNY